MFMDEMFQKYPYTVRIYQKKGKSLFVVNDVGRRARMKDGTTALRLKREKTDLPFTDFEYMCIDEKGNHMMDYYSTAEGEFFPMEIRENDKILEKYPIDKDALFWFILDYDRKQKKYAKQQATWEKLLPLMYIGIMAAGIGFATIITYDGLVKITSQAGGMLQIFDRLVDRLEAPGGLAEDAVAPQGTTVQTEGGTTVITAPGGG